MKWSVIGQFENVARKGDRGPVPSRQAAKKTVNQRDIEEDARRSPALPLRPFSCTFGTALTRVARRRYSSLCTRNVGELAAADAVAHSFRSARVRIMAPGETDDPSLLISPAVVGNAV